ncbi:MAG: class I SAM-dependent methyltransferase [Candidatus Hermodarchaeota archaeon]
MTEKITFSFGKNWQSFLRLLDEDRIKNAKLSLTEIFELTDFQNISFLDIGCGSGLFSYAAYLLGAKKIVSFDVDHYSVLSCRYFHKLEKYPEYWKIYEESILDEQVIDKFGKFDIVYSFGVLHHTGQMWKAIRNAAKFVKNGGYFFIAIYNKLEGFNGSDNWLKVKKLYNSSPKILKILFEIQLTLNFIGSSIMRFKNPLREIINYKKRRGMNFLVDVRDSLGGYPYEYATIKEITRFMKLNFPNFKLLKVKESPGLGNNWYLFKRD